ncbi:hypothetical protein [Ferruginibacter sp.]|nr:hypothetical protein [Ferruginibacter sp.]
MSNDLITPEKYRENNDQIISYIILRILIGATGIALPFLLMIGKLIANNSTQIEFSVSDYYDNGTAGDILVGILFVLGLFLMAYKGYERIDSIAANLGGSFALGVALFPTTSSNYTIHIMHFVFALLLFSTFIFFSIYLFRKTDPKKVRTKQKTNRNRIYLICGIIMIVCVAAIAVGMIWLTELSQTYHLVFWFESIALIAFGFSWVTKAEVLFLRDEGKKGSAVV